MFRELVLVPSLNKFKRKSQTTVIDKSRCIVLGAVMMARGRLWGCIFAIAIYSLGAKSAYGAGIGN